LRTIRTPPLKRLPDAEIETPKRVTSAWIQGDAEVEPKWPYRRIIPNPRPDADTQIAYIIAW
jgi:hypothetical protein